MMIEEFVKEMKRFLPEEARVMLCQFRGDPYGEQRGKWRAYVLNDAEMIDDRANVYLCVSGMKKNERGEFRRRKENFSAGLLLMIDDLGAGAGSKFPLSTIDAAPPSALIETSPGNFQAIYFFDGAVTDMKEFEALIRAFINKEFLGKDTGMAGVNRVFRPPAGINGKPKHNGFPVSLAEWNPGRRYSVADLAKAFELELVPERPRLPPKWAQESRPDNVAAFVRVRQVLRGAGMLKTEEVDVGGWSDVYCPWTEEHGGSVDNGAAIRIPDAENGWHGAFKCHHGSCERKGWRDLTDWIGDAQGELLNEVNARSPVRMPRLIAEKKK